SRHQRVDVLFKQFGSLVAEQFLRACIDELYAALLVHHDNAGGCAFEQSAHVLFLRHNAVHQRVYGDNDSEVYAAKKDEPEQLNEFATPQLETKGGWKKKIPFPEHRTDEDAHRWPTPPHE